MRSVLLERLQKADPAGAAADVGWGLTGAYGERYEPESRREFVDAYRDRVWTGRCINLIATSATQVKMQVRLRGAAANEWEDDHDLIQLLKRPNPRDPALMFFEWTIKWAEMIGEWYWELVPSIGGGIAELFPLRGHLVRIEPGVSGRPGGYVYDPAATGVEIVKYGAQEPGQPSLRGREDLPICLAGRYASPVDDYYGMGPLRAAKDDIISEYYGVRYDHRFFRNSARPDIVIGFKNRQDKEQRRANKEAWDDFKGVDRAHRAAVLDGDPKVTVLSQNQKDVEYLEGRRLSREGQCAAFGVPPVLVGDLTRATYSNYEVAEYIFWKETMLPKLEFFATWANFVLLPYFEDVEEFAFDTSEIAALQQSEGWRSDRIRGEVAGGLLTPNEGRELLDREQVEEDGADSLWMPTKSRPIDAPPPTTWARSPTDAGQTQTPPAGDPTAVPPGDAPAGDLPDAGAAAGKGNGRVHTRSALLIPAAQRSDEHKAQISTWLRNGREAKGRFAERAKLELAQHFGAQRDRILAIIDGQEKSAELERLLIAYGWSADDAKLHQIVDAMQAGLADAAMKLTVDATGQLPKDGTLEQILRAIGNRADGIQSVTGRVKDEVIDQVRLGIQHGLTYRQIAEGGTFESGGEKVTIKGIQGVYDEYTTWQAERIARTEAGMTFNRASAAAMRDAEVGEVDIVDGDDDEACAEANGSRWMIDEYEADPLEHPNCTRIGLPVIEVPAAAAAGA